MTTNSNPYKQLGGSSSRKIGGSPFASTPRPTAPVMPVSAGNSPFSIGKTVSTPAPTPAPVLPTAVPAVVPAIIPPAVPPVPPTPPTPPAPKPEAPVTPSSAPITVDAVIRELVNLPAAISFAQGVFDSADRSYKVLLADATIRAFSAPLFPGKKDGEPNRCAGNDTEREVAVEKTISSDMKLVEAARDREAALRSLQQLRNQFEAYKLIAGLLTSTASTNGK